MNKRLAALLAVLCLVSLGAIAKLPPPSEEAQAKAAEAKAKADEAAKADAELLAKTQDRVAAKYIQAMKAKGVIVKPTPITAPVVPAVPAPPPTAAAMKK